ncbi:hypothetical protein C0581_00965 [Candidatus Parcubacteria bacterium]|nr:MAG: hypothetical protein C0581_00965 [Candidatus Parcubacteria bacterium]
MVTKQQKEQVERVTLKLPKSVASYFRKMFPHGKRSEFVVQCLEKYQHEQEVIHMEKELKKVGSIRQV